VTPPRPRGAARSRAASAPPPASRYIAVEGVIGVGKTTLAKRLAKSLDAALVLEVVEENPFLPRFYEDPESFSFQTQMYFLLSRYRQQLELSQRDLFAESVIADYMFAKDQIFATINLGEAELALYRTILPLLEARLHRPDLVIYLQATTEVLLDRIKRRGRPFEREIGREYLETLAEAYNHFFFHYADTPLLIVNTSEMDLAASDDDYEKLMAVVRTHGSGTRYVGVR
jgi:deoxyadenosine/deoxycytidine kinase